ncbi:MAG: helix-turn-helix transcriptional regulator [Clostridia bacterium]|nr:helix-turn-helix transcriptional regulator [Clostridia bacterium]
MTSGEKINYYRKQLGLSQEELGQKLLVSRQTVSLWEKGQTVPTIDNLIRLKEIFGVSVDEILGCEEEKETRQDVPIAKESYNFRYTQEEINSIFKQSNKQLLSRIIVFAVFAVVFLVWMFFEDEAIGFLGVATGFMLMTVIMLIKTISVNNKNSKKTVERLPKCSYDIKVYDNYFTATVTRDNEIKSSFKFDFNDIEQFLDYGDFLYIVVNGNGFILRKNSLAPNSIFTLLAKSNPEKTIVNKKGMTATKVFLNILFVATLFSEFIPMLIMGCFSLNEEFMQENQWLFLTALPIPIASLVLGIIFKRKGFKCTKNIVVGIIFSLMLIMLGISASVADDTIDNSEWAVLRAEETIGVDLPECESVQTVEMNTETTSPTKGYIYYTSRITFEDRQSNDFEKEIADNGLWMNQMPNNFAGIISPFSSIYMGDYRLIYNVDTNEFNSIPEEEGTYKFLYLCYDFEENLMIIDEYDIEYIK